MIFRTAQAVCNSNIQQIWVSGTELLIYQGNTITPIFIVAVQYATNTRVTESSCKWKETSIYIHRDVLSAETSTREMFKENCEPCIFSFVDAIVPVYLFYCYKEDINIQVGLFNLDQIILSNLSTFTDFSILHQWAQAPTSLLLQLSFCVHHLLLYNNYS